ncbi:hypothetical protein NMY22_g15012 [Coprinellus aureogranulatus]|nr:hypothetical protein NMY22_g15012 [Coprinellus aureogranulatus]
MASTIQTPQLWNKGFIEWERSRGTSAAVTYRKEGIADKYARHAGGCGDLCALGMQNKVLERAEEWDSSCSTGWVLTSLSERREKGEPEVFPDVEAES